MPPYPLDGCRPSCFCGVKEEGKGKWERGQGWYRRGNALSLTLNGNVMFSFHQQYGNFAILNFLKIQYLSTIHSETGSRWAPSEKLSGSWEHSISRKKNLKSSCSYYWKLVKANCQIKIVLVWQARWIRHSCLGNKEYQCSALLREYYF